MRSLNVGWDDNVRFRPNADVSSGPQRSFKSSGGTFVVQARYPDMPMFRISIVNETFRSSNHHEAATASDAHQRAIKGALEIGVEEVAKGKPFFAAEVQVENGRQLVGRFVVSMGWSPLQMSQA